MTLQTHKTAVGAFVLGGLALLILGIFLLGGRRLLSSSDDEFVMYFDGSVSGLSKGAPVVFRGVPMGNVTRINLVANKRKSNVTIPVFVRINVDSFTIAEGANPNITSQEIIRGMVQRGLRASLQLQSIITGQYLVELDFYPSTPAHFRSSTPMLEIPTIPSPIDTLQSTISQMPLEQMVNALNATLQHLSQGLKDDRLGKALAAFEDTFTEARNLLRGQARTHAEEVLRSAGSLGAAVEKELPPALAAFRDAMQNMSMAAAQLRTATASAQSLLRHDSPPVGDLRRLLKECTDAARSLRQLAEMLERNPEALLKGKRGGR